MPPFRLPLPLNLSYPTVNAYLFTSPEPVLIDCGVGTAESLSALETGLAEHGLTTGDLAKVVVTHPHVDHVGQAGTLARQGVEVWLSFLANEWTAGMEAQRAALTGLILSILEDGGFEAPAIAAARAFLDRLTGMYTRIPKASVQLFSPGDRLEFGGWSWLVLYAPGHSNRQVCFYSPENGALLSADMLLPKAPVPVIEPMLDDPGQREKGLATMLDSFAFFKQLDVEVVYPGHGAPFRDHRERINAQLARIRRRTRRCRDLIASGVGTLPALLDAMYSHLDPVDRMGGLAMLIGYLDLLTDGGQVNAVDTPEGRLWVSREPETGR